MCIYLIKNYTAIHKYIWILNKNTYKVYNKFVVAMNNVSFM